MCVQLMFVNVFVKEIKMKKSAHRVNTSTHEQNTITISTSWHGQTSTLICFITIVISPDTSYLFSTMSNMAVITIVNLVSL